MIIKASGRSALMLATGLWLCFAGPSQAAAGAANATAAVKSEAAASAPVALSKFAKHGSRKTYAHRKSGPVALKSSDDKKPAATDATADDGDNSTAIPPSVANANAKLTSADTATGNAKAMSARANDMLQAAPADQADSQAAAATQVVAADQLNEVDRALHESKPAAATAVASTDAPAAPVLAGSNENSTWDQTSLIGKIFIAFGGLLTLASAARMFMG